MNGAPTVGGLFSGAGLLDFGLHLAGWEHAWLCESDPYRSELLRARFPGAVVYDDVRTVRGPFAPDADGDERPQEHASNDSIDGERAAQRRRPVEPARIGGLAASDGRRHPRTLPPAGSTAPGHACAVDLIAGGFPCKGGSTAGKRGGFEHAETVLWFEMRRVIREVRPRYVLIENVANLLGMAASPGEPAGSLWGTVLGDLAALGFGDIRWDCLPAAAVGAPHLRDRVFAVATYTEREPVELRRGTGAVGGTTEGGGGEARQQRVGRAAADRDQDAASDADVARRPARRQPEHSERCRPRNVADEVARAAPADADERELWAGRDGGRADRVQANTRSAASVAVDWGDYAPAIQRWEAIHGPAPEPLVRRLDDGNPQLQRLRARVDRSRLSALGDGVHVYCGWIVGEYVMGLERERLRDAA